ncbi:hypothetical protein GQ53DRAFT_207924 [Thozetella sp. PMI_491]|nr:hypothetical protein GQ53DRAFT_207924 [Thozetella sp. PMI_491]
MHLSTLLLAVHGAAALDAALRPQALAVVVAAATTTDPGLLACATVEAFVDGCYSAGYLDSTVPSATEAACLCCSKGTNIATAYSSCQSYVAASAKTATDAYSLASLGYNICSKAGNVCGAVATPTATATGATTKVTTDAATSVTSAVGAQGAAACSSLIGIVTSCSSAVPGWSTLAASSMASCLCYSSSKYNTKFDDYASVCAPYAKTSLTSQYSAVSELQTFCEDYPPATATTRTSTTSTSKTSTTGAGGVTAAGSSTSSTSAAATVFVTRSSSAFAPPTLAGGVAVWLANAMTFVLSFFILI